MRVSAGRRIRANVTSRGIILASRGSFAGRLPRSRQLLFLLGELTHRAWRMVDSTLVSLRRSSVLAWNPATTSQPQRSALDNDDCAGGSVEPAQVSFSSRAETRARGCRRPPGRQAPG